MSKLPAIDLPERANLRDIGGYPTRSGATLASGRLFRSAELCTVDPAISARLVEAVGVRRVIDLRMEGEVREGAHTLPGVCEWIHLPLFAAIPPHWLQPTDRTPTSTAQRYFEMLQIGRSTLGRVVTLLTELPAKPTLIHCVAGRDRTGIIIACVLDLLDVPEDVIAADYALSEVMDDAEGRHAHPENILGLLELLRAEYGSTRQMLLDVGVPDDTIDRLKTALVAV